MNVPGRMLSQGPPGAHKNRLQLYATEFNPILCLCIAHLGTFLSALGFKNDET